MYVDSVVCKLCQIPGQFAVQSHVVPRSYFHFVSDNGKHLAVKGRGVAQEQNSHPEPLMCGSCDHSFSAIESYVRARLSRWLSYAGNLDKVDPLAGTRISIDYKKAKLFVLLMAWRAAVATGPFFGEVQLPPPLVEALRQRLITLDPGLPSFCPFSVDIESSRHLTRMLFTPETLGVQLQLASGPGVMLSWTAFRGTLTVYVSVGEQDWDDDILTRCLQQDGQLLLGYEDSFRLAKFRAAGDIIRAPGGPRPTNRKT